MSAHPATAPDRSHRASMFWRMLVRAAVQRRGRALSALAAMIVAAATVTAMLNLVVDVQAKLRREFRKYGANIVVVAREGESLPPQAESMVNSLLQGRGLAAPFAYVVARTASDKPIVVAGTDFAQVRKLDNWWAVTGWPGSSAEALIGARAGAALQPQNGDFLLTFQGRSVRLHVAGTLHTGAAEDSRVYLSLADFKSWTGVLPTTIEIGFQGSADELNEAVGGLAQALPAAEVRAVRQVTEGEARVLGKTRATLLASSILIVLTASLCVLSTLMGWVFDRRRDFAIMKALGASERLIRGFFAAEAALLGASGAVLGYAIGVGVAAWIGRANFHAPVVPRFSVLPLVLGGGVSVALLAAWLPISLLRRVQPAMILRGE